MSDYHYYFNYPLNNGDYHSDHLNNESATDPYESESVKNYDRMLYQTLLEIFRERSSLSRDQVKELLRATNDNPIIDLILEKEPKLSQVFPECRQVPLLWISVLGYFHNSTELLVYLGADVNELYEYPVCEDMEDEMTILQLLIMMYPSMQNERLIRLVINHGADLRARDFSEETALNCAASQGRVQVARWLLEKRDAIDINAVDSVKKTPLLTAADTEKAGELIPLFIKHGADATHIDVDGQNVLHILPWASNVDHVELAKLLIEKGASVVHSSDTQGQPINQATCAGKHELVKLYLDHGADVNALQGNGYNFPLYFAAIQSDPLVLLTLLKHGANIDQKTHPGGLTALHVACGRGEITNVNILLDVGADMFVKDSYGRRPLALVDHKNVENVEAMLKTLAIKRTTHLKPQIELTYERHIKDNFPNLWNYFMDCLTEIERMKSTRFIPTCTFFDLLEKCQCELSELMRNNDFERKFRLYDIVEVFPTYANDLIKAFELAENFYNSTLQQENIIDDAVGNTLPYIVVRKVARYMLNCEICEMKKIVRASRRSDQQATDVIMNSNSET